MTKECLRSALTFDNPFFIAYGGEFLHDIRTRGFGDFEAIVNHALDILKIILTRKGIQNILFEDYIQMLTFINQHFGVIQDMDWESIAQVTAANMCRVRSQMGRVTQAVAQLNPRSILVEITPRTEVQSDGDDDTGSNVSIDSNDDREKELAERLRDLNDDFW